MANLIPPEAKKSIVREYWIRVVSVWLGILGAALLVVSVLNVPVYVLIQNQLQTYNGLYTDANTKQNSFEEIESQIITSNSIATLLAGAKRVQPVVPYVTELEELTSRTVTVNRFELVRNDTKLESIKISGIASDRASLVAFSDRVEAAESFANAEIPLSNLAKDRDIPFAIDVIIATEE